MASAKARIKIQDQLEGLSVDAEVKALDTVREHINNLSAEDGGKKKLIQDIGNLIDEAEDLVKNTGGDLAEKSKAELMEKLERLKKSCRKIDENRITGVH